MDYDGEKPHKSQIRLARLKGLEPLTHCLEGSCSIHLSYGRLKVQVSAKRCLNIILCERPKVKAL